MSGNGEGEAGLSLEDDAGKNLVLKEYQEANRRRKILFWGIVGFLALDALAFFVLLFWVFCLMANNEGADWHLMGFAVIPGALLATIALMAMRAVFNLGGKQGVQELSSMLQTIQNAQGSWVDS